MLSKLITKTDDLLMPCHVCISCGREILDGSKYQLCGDCSKNIKWITGRTCVKCGDMLLDDKLVCDTCKEKDYLFLSNKSCCYYDDYSDSIVKGLKYNSQKYLAESMAKIMADRVEDADKIDIISFVPMTKKRERERGFNQSEELAKFVAKILNKPVLPLLDKVVDSKHQAGASQKDRLQNLIGTFSIKADAKKLVKNKGVLIVDDVFTTGATINECTRALLCAKPKFVESVTFAKTKFDIFSH